MVLCQNLIQLFRLQKYKKFESNSQHKLAICLTYGGCFDCKSTKNLRAIHNCDTERSPFKRVVSTAKVQKIWEQFTTLQQHSLLLLRLFRLQKYKKFESNSQLRPYSVCVYSVVSTAKVQKIWEQFTTMSYRTDSEAELFRLQKYKKFESNSQHSLYRGFLSPSCFDCKSTKNLRAIHNG